MMKTAFVHTSRDITGHSYMLFSSVAFHPLSLHLIKVVVCGIEKNKKQLAQMCHLRLSSMKQQINISSFRMRYLYGSIALIKYHYES